MMSVRYRVYRDGDYQTSFPTREEAEAHVAAGGDEFFEIVPQWSIDPAGLGESP